MALRKRTDSYWLKRANQRLTRSERISKAHMRELAKVYNEARRQTVEGLKQIYAAYYKGQDGFDMQALRSIVPSGELKSFLDEMKKLGISTDLPDNYNARITRLRFINEQLAAQAHKVATSEQAIDTKALREVYTDSYYRAGYDVAKGIGSTPSSFSTLDQRTVDKVMNARFEGRNFSTRVWKNSDILASKLKSELAAAIATGQSIQKTAANFRNDFNVNQYYAERLIRTETNHFHNSAELEAYKEMGFEKFKFLATLDNRTSEICQEMDGKIFNVKDGLPGENIPPLHPNCRSTIVPYFKEYEPETRLYRDPVTGKNRFGHNITYAEWRQGYIDNVVNNVVGGAMEGGMVKTGYGVNFDANSLWGVDGRVLKNYSGQLQKLMGDYPMIEQWPKNGLKISGESKNSRAMAWAFRHKPEITLNSRYHYSLDKIMKTVKGGIDRHHFMPSKTYANYIINHEYGHYVENYLMKKNGTSQAKITRDIIRIAKTRYNMPESELPKTLSKYGAKNNAEFFAECFANARGGRPNALGKAMNDYLRENLK